MNADATFLDMLREITHDGFMVTTWVFTAMTLFIVGLALYRLVPRRNVNLIAEENDDRVSELASESMSQRFREVPSERTEGER